MKVFLIYHDDGMHMLMQPQTDHDKRVIAAIGELDGAQRTRFVTDPIGSYIACKPFQSYGSYDGNPDVILKLPPKSES